MQKSGQKQTCLSGKTLAMIFAKSSTRTRVSFEVGATQLGGTALFLSTADIQLGRGEPISDTAQVLSRMVDGIMIRTFKQSDLEALAKYGSIPIINGLTDEFHPTQILADMLTIREHFGKLKGIHMVYMGDARFNMGRSLMVGSAKLGLHFTACAPEGYFPDEDLVKECQAIAEETGAVIDFSSDPHSAVKGADVIYTDIWVSMGEPKEVWDERIALMKPFQVNKQLMEAAGSRCIFMHCLPSYHNLGTQIGKEVGERYGMDALEVTDEVFESEQSLVFTEAENRMHTIKAVMAATL
jgi:ornithine carbamoyltransferase